MSNKDTDTISLKKLEKLQADLLAIVEKLNNEQAYELIVPYSDHRLSSERSGLKSEGLYQIEL